MGGDNWNASVINEAYRVLSNNERRAEYDAQQHSQMMGIGEINRASNQRAQASWQQCARQASIADSSRSAPSSSFAIQKGSLFAEQA